MKTLKIEKLIIYSIAVTILLVLVPMMSDIIHYSDATKEISNGNYEAAVIALDKLDGFRDAEVLKEYCEIMSEYDSGDFVSIYHCYRGLNDLEGKLTNDKLTEEFTKTTTEVETLYKHYNVSLSAK